ncbi:MAG: hypothetical protein MUP63_02595 [Candidatus Nanohaloarchaeota archaeon QJJ-7]|nr:hypothetical protein [Candidatus Nanohaloarchaeota archaeon QJJ-7]
MVYPSVNGGEAETISDDPNFSVFSAMEVDNPSSTPILEYGWNTNDTIEAGPWAREGFGEKVSGSDLFDTEEDGFILHAWTPSLGSGKWFPSNVSQSVQIPETVENARVVMRGKSAAYLLKNISRDTCKDTEMRLTVIPSQGQPIQKTTVVSYDMENLTIDVSDYVGEEIGIVGGTMPYDGSQCEGGTNYLYIDSLFVERIR